MELRSRCNNAIHLLNHFKKLGVRESKILNGLSVNKKHITNPHNWITVKDWYKMMDNCHAAAPFTTLDDWFKIGFYLKDSETSKIFEMITKLVGIRTMYKLVPKYSNNFNTYMRIDLNTIGSDYADYTIKTDKTVISNGIGLMVRYTSGVCSIIPHIIYQKPAVVDILFDQAILKNIIEQLYKFHNLTYSEKNGCVYVNNHKIGKRIQLLKASSEDEIYSNIYSFNKPHNAIIIVENLTVDGYILLHKGDIFNAPYGRVVFKWEKQNRALVFFKSSKLKNEILVHLNEQIFLAEQRYFESERLRSKEKKYIAQLQTTLAELVSIEERERRSIAEDLHDTVTQTLGLGISNLKNTIEEKALQKDYHFKAIQKIFEKALEEVRSLTFQISSPILYDFGIEAALEELSSNIKIKHGVRVEFFNKIQNPLILDDTLKTILYRSVRELFINMLKHSKSKDVYLSISQKNGSLIINFEDTGVGFDSITMEKRRKSKFGLFNINERVKILNGQFKIDSVPGNGTKIEITVPIEEESREV
ncbi:MAG: hypothetical protein DRH93_13620 [Deltaproteobacteria bacterium]|nr:MAG: hypothetical protein DRH93_13620 [Deltaproteobacteria bacterium]